MALIYDLALGIGIGMLATMLLELGFYAIESRTGGKLSFRINGFHFHHSLFGVLLFAIYFLFVQLPVLIGAGVGVIAWHTYSEKKLALIDRS